MVCVNKHIRLCTKHRKSFKRKIYKTTLGIQMNYMHYADRDKIGSGNEQTNEPYKSEVSLYLKWKN